MFSFIDEFIRHYKSVAYVFIIILITGTYAYLTIPKEREPDIQIPYIIISMHHEGISPEDAERILLKPMEKELRSIEGIKEMTSYAYESNANVILEFYAGFKSDKALADVRDKVDKAKADLPVDTDEPEIKEINLSLFPVLNVILKGKIEERTLAKIADNLKDKIEEIPNVLEVKIKGKREEAVEIVIDPVVLENYQIQAGTINTINTGFNQLIAAGSIENQTGNYSIKIPGLFKTVDDMLSTPVLSNGDKVVTIGDIAKIHKTFKDPTSIARVNGETAVVLEISKRSGTNIIETIDLVKQAVENEKQFLPANLDIIYSQDKSDIIKNLIIDLQNNIILAALLVLLVVLYYVGFRSSFLVTISIPGSFLIGILMINFLGLTLNIVVLFSLILSIGMLVDSAIIISEMADRKMIEGVNHTEAYSISAHYMKWPIINSTATTVVVFMPLLFWPGLIGQFMQYLPITLISVLTGSLIVAILFLPPIGSMLGKPGIKNHNLYINVIAAESGKFDELKGFVKKYYQLLNIVLTRPKLFVFSISATLIIVYSLYIMFGKGVEFFPNIEPESAQIQIRTRGNLSIYEKDKIMREAELRVLNMTNDIKVFYSTTSQTQTSSENTTEDTIGTIQIEYNDWKIRRKSSEIVKDIVHRLSDIPGIKVEIKEDKPGPAAAKPIELQVSSRFPSLLLGETNRILDGMNKIGGFKDVETNIPVPKIEWSFAINRELAGKYQVGINELGTFVKLVSNGIVATTYRPDDSDDEIDIIVRFPENKRNLDSLNMLKIPTATGNIPATNFITRKAANKVTTIERSEGFRTFTIKANVEDNLLANGQITKLKEWFAENPASENIQIKFKGEEADQQETKAFLQKAFSLAIIFMAMILLTQFNSFYQTAIILSAIIFSTVGVLLGLLITNQPFGIVMCGVGIISLAGIVVNNNIIFIDTYSKLIEEGDDVRDALIKTGIQRLRPILLTAGTTVLGLLPMVFAMNIDFITGSIFFGAPSSQWWTQLSTAIAGGLSFATILTLFFTPSLIMMIENRKTANRKSGVHPEITT